MIHIKKRFWASNPTYVIKNIHIVTKWIQNRSKKYSNQAKKMYSLTRFENLFWTGVKRFHTVEKHITVNWCVKYGTFFWSNSGPNRVQKVSQKWRHIFDSLNHLRDTRICSSRTFFYKIKIKLSVCKIFSFLYSIFYVKLL